MGAQKLAAFKSQKDDGMIKAQGAIRNSWFNFCFSHRLSGLEKMGMLRLNFSCALLFVLIVSSAWSKDCVLLCVHTVSRTSWVEVELVRGRDLCIVAREMAICKNQAFCGSVPEIFLGSVMDFSKCEEKGISWTVPSLSSLWALTQELGIQVQVPGVNWAERCLEPGSLISYMSGQITWGGWETLLFRREKESKSSWFCLSAE